MKYHSETVYDSTFIHLKKRNKKKNKHKKKEKEKNGFTL